MGGPHLTPAQLTKAVERVATLVQGCPDPEAWASTLTSSADFAPVGARLLAVVPQLDALQLREVVCAMATLKLRHPPLVSAVCEAISGNLHSLTSTDTAK
eukprot:5381499-Prymnesium_polylepis.1